jgi:hypothetical protein
MVKGALEVRERLDALHAGAAKMTPEQFQEAYHRFLTDVQVHL